MSNKGVMQFLSLNNPCSLALLSAVCFCYAPAFTAIPQDLHSSEPASQITSAQRLAMEQVVELVEVGQRSEAIANLQKLSEQGTRLVPSGPVRLGGTQAVQSYLPLSEWCRHELAFILSHNPDLSASYLTQWNEISEGALQSLRQSKDILQSERAAQRYHGTAFGNELALLHSDLCLERGWSIAASRSLERHNPGLFRIPVGQPISPADTGCSIPSYRAWSEIFKSSGDSLKADAWLRDTLARQNTPPNLEELKRYLLAAAIDSQTLDLEWIKNWTLAACNGLPENEAIAAREWCQQFKSQPQSKRSAVEIAFDLGTWPHWQRQLEQYSATGDQTPASRPRAGELEDGGILPYFPSIYEGKVFINELTQIKSLDLESGKPWPDITPPLPLFDSNISPSSFIPRGYPLQGVPRGLLTIHEGYLYARMGSPVTAWANRDRSSDGGSMSYLVGLDLKKQGSLLPGFPLRLEGKDFNNAEFEGCPAVWGQSLIVAVAERDNVGIRRSIAAFDRYSGELQWRSAVLCSGTVVGSDRANLIANQTLTLAGGDLFYNTNLGTIACLSPLTGNIQWLTRYRRVNREQTDYPRPNRFRYRDQTPCLVSGGLVICMPQDCPEVFALDAISGELLWSTDDEEVADATHIVGVENRTLVVSGDRLIWLDRDSGRTIARFPGRSTPGVHTALNSPRGLGRGAIIDGQILWPTAGEILFFPADLLGQQWPHVDNPPMSARQQLGIRGSEGGNILHASGWLLYATPSRLLAWQRNQAAPR